MKKILLLSSFVLSVASISGQDFGIQDDDVPAGLMAGDEAPDFSAQTSDGETFVLSDALKENAIALVFYRGSWCPHCSSILSAYADSLSYLEELGIRIVAVSPEEYKNVVKTTEDTSVPFTVLSDSDGDIMRAYDVDFRVTDAYDEKIVKYKGTSISEMNGTDEAELPIPATYLIVREGHTGKNRIVWRHFNPDYTNRARVSDIRDAYQKPN